MANNIIDNFNKFFEILPAISDELKIEAYKLRYQVYCIENDYLNSEDYPDNLEFDDFDRHSIHYLIRHRESGAYAATTRLILPDPNNPEKLFPLELNCKIDNVAEMQSINRMHLGEISRFGASKAFKKRKNEANTLATTGTDFLNDLTLAQSRTFPCITLALMACLIKASNENDIHYAYAAMEQSLLRFITSLGIDIIQIGSAADYHGERFPTLVKGTDMLNCLAKKNLDTWNFLTDNGIVIDKLGQNKTVNP